ncbi:MAG: dimethyl sulfoxide reductase anchor subunit [Planctomycetota bacterium]|nr:dimethyl sulfoxide reductase anchor subunit [Planctomycetota bacterium]
MSKEAATIEPGTIATDEHSVVATGPGFPQNDNPSNDSTSSPTLLGRLLADQQELTAVEQFSLAYSEQTAPAQSKFYSSLIPATPPGPGQQYAFDVNLDQCSGCKACVTACHSLNGLDETETWRDVGLLIGGTSTNPVMQHVTTACHHCLEPACMTACPVDAYEKNLITGIVKHLDDQCFGCQYCTLACPYDVPKYHKQKGIVRKCDMCSDRLSAGEAPACVQSCPHEAISIRIVDCERVIEDSEADRFLPAAPEPHITLPTTTYRTKRVFPRNLLPADYFSVSAQHPHWPLIIMLVLTQLSVGAFLSGLVLERFLDETLIATMRPVHSMSALVFGLLALASSTLHLGRPQFAWRAVIGLRHSWLSREIVAFGVFAALAIVYAAGNWFAPELLIETEFFRSWLGWGVAASGLIGVFCSVMIYAFTQRAFWSFTQSSIRFGLTTCLLGVAAVWLTLLLVSTLGSSAASVSVSGIIATHGGNICQSLLLLMGLKLLFEANLLRPLMSRQITPMKRSAMLMTGSLASVTIARFACGILGGLAMPALLLRATSETPQDPVFLVIVTSMLFVACLAGELLERYLFFAAVASPRMPGSLRS